MDTREWTKNSVDMNADDVTIFLTTPEDISKFETILTQYERESGLTRIKKNPKPLH
jgi:hypothetical protein